MSAHDQAGDAGRVHQGFDEHVHAFPGIEVPGVAGHRRPACDGRTAGGRRLRRRRVPFRGCAGRLPSGGIRHDKDAIAGAESDGQLVCERARDGHVRRGAEPHAALAPIEAAELAGRRTERRVAEQARHLLAHDGADAMGFVHDRRTPRARHLEQEGGYPQIARPHDVDGTVARRPQRCQQECRPAGGGRTGPGDAVDPEPRVGGQAVEHERVARRHVRILPGQQPDLVPAPGQGVAARHGL